MKPCILIIDNDRPMLNALGELLSLRGYQVKTADNINEGLFIYKLQHRQIHTVLLDLNVGSADYRFIIPGLLSIEPDVKIIAMSQSINFADLPDFFRKNISFFLQKPFAVKNLLKGLNHSLPCSRLTYNNQLPVVKINGKIYKRTRHGLFKFSKIYQYL